MSDLLTIRKIVNGVAGACVGAVLGVVMVVILSAFAQTLEVEGVDDTIHPFSRPSNPYVHIQTGPLVTLSAPSDVIYTT